jgi:NAD(P)H-hydrate epimerase
MASAGMGDALTGVVASFRGQGLGPEAAAILGATVHARAGDRAAIAGQRGLLALDLVDAIRSQVNP